MPADVLAAVTIRNLRFRYLGASAHALSIDRLDLATGERFAPGSEPGSASGLHL